MQLHLSPSLRHLMVSPVKGVRELVRLKISPKWVSYRVLCSLIFSVFLLRFLFLLSAIESFDNGGSPCSSLGCMGRRIRQKKIQVPNVIYQVLKEPIDQDVLNININVPQTLEEFVTEVQPFRKDAKLFAIKLRDMVAVLEERTRKAKIKEYFYRQIASSAIPKPLHCLSLKLANEHAKNSAARLHLPSPGQAPSLVDNSLFHVVLASDNILAASVVANSLIKNALNPQKIVLHLITDSKTFSPMQAWFSLHPLPHAIIEIKPLDLFDWFSRGKIPVMEAMEKDAEIRARFRGGSREIARSVTEKPHVIAAKLQALSPKYNSLMNHIRIYLPELFPSLKRVLFLDDDVVVQSDLSPLFQINLNGKVNGAVETCTGDDTYVMSKRFKNYLNFSNPIIATEFDPEECAWAFGVNIFDLEEWRKTNISATYHYWVDKNLKEELSLWQLGTLPPGLIAFRGHVHKIPPFWHKLGLGYQENTSVAEAARAGVVHFNGRAKPWLETAFPQFRRLWAKYVNFSDEFVRSCGVK